MNEAPSIRLKKVPLVEKNRFYCTKRRHIDYVPSKTLTEWEEENDFLRWASHLDDSISLLVYNVNSPFCGIPVDATDEIDLDEVLCETRTVAQWGSELARLEDSELPAGHPHIARMHYIVKMLKDYRLIWRGGPAWWRTL